MKTIPTLSLVALMLILCGTQSVQAQFAIPWYTIDGGGGFSSAGAFELNGTIGQHDAGTVMTGGSFTLAGGFWAGGSASSILLGDVNQDGVVNLLDVAPFVNAITTGTFIAEADINQDGVVDLLDVAPFVDLLTS